MFGKYREITYLYSVLNCPNLFQYGALGRQTKIIIVCLFLCLKESSPFV